MAWLVCHSGAVRQIEARPMMRNRVRRLASLFCAFAVVSCPAGVVTQNSSSGATNWPGNPLVMTVTNPASQTSVGEGFNAVGGCTNYCETFTVAATNYTLQAISIYAGGGTGTGTGTNLTLRLFDLGTQAAPNPSPYSPGTDLFNSGGGLSVTCTPQTSGVLEFDFTGSDQVTLTNGHLYAFEIDGVLNTWPLVWRRTIADTYSGGAAYRNQTWINGMNSRDFALAVYATILVNTNTANTNRAWLPDGIVFHAFPAAGSGVNLEGANPAAGLALAGGVLCGTTLNGGSQGAGTAFWMTPDGTNFNAFRAFTNAPDAGGPQGELAVAGNGFFGVAFGGGSSGAGAVFVGQTNGSVTVLKSFAVVSADNATNSGGASPGATLVLSGSTLFGTTTAGGAAANGTVFSLATNGATFSVLHDFSGLDSNTGTNSDGAVPCGSLVLSGDTLYGTASGGGAGGSGVVFSVGTNGANFTVLHSFAPLDPLAATNADGAMPLGGLVLSNATLYGTTFTGGGGGSGTVFSLQTNGGGFTVLHHFTAVDSVTATNADGAAPGAALRLSSKVLYGTASAGGAGAAGTVFSLSPDGAQFATIHSFAAVAASGTNIDGAFPVAPVLCLGNSLYGTAFSGGPGAAGTVFNLAIPAPPAVITNVVRNLNGSVALIFLGAPNSTNVVQSATNLAPPVAWQNVSTNIADADGAWQFIQTNLTNPAKFYRSYAP
jgi:uncharacterized repeat protein (TIGR03803 family)